MNKINKNGAISQNEFKIMRDVLRSVQLQNWILCIADYSCVLAGNESMIYMYTAIT